MDHHLVVRKRTANTGQRRCLVLVGPAHHGVNLKPCGGLNDALDPVHIADARQLNQNLVGAEAVGFDSGLADAESIDTVANGLNRLLDGLFVQGLFHQWPHGQRKAGVRATAGQIVFAGVLGIEERTRGADIGRRHAFHSNCFRLVWIGLVNLREVQVGSLEILLNAPYGVVGLSVDGFRDDYLQDQVHAAAEIETQVNPVAHRIHEGLAAHSGRDPEDAVQANEQDRNNQENLVLQILLHCSVSLLQIA